MKEAIRTALALARIRDGERFEVARKTRRGLSGRLFVDADEAARWLGAGPDRYVGLSPLRADAVPRKGRALDQHVDEVRTLLVDVDPADAAAATRAAAGDAMAELRALLAGRCGVRAPLIDSGRGQQLWLPHEPRVADDLAKRVRQRFLRACARHVDRNGVKVDLKVYNASRLARLPGPWPNSRTGEEPRIVDHGDGREARFEDLELFADEILGEEAGSTRPAPAPRPVPRGGVDLAELAREYLEGATPAVSGQSGHNVAMGVVRELVHGFDLTDDEALGLLPVWNQRCAPPWSDRELEHKVAQAQSTPDPRGRPRGWKIGPAIRRAERAASTRTPRSGRGTGAAPTPAPAAPKPPAPPEPPAGGSAGGGSDERRRIVVSADLVEMLDRADEAIVAAADVELYQRTGVVVRVSRTGPDRSPAIEPIPEGALREHMARAADWVALRPKGDELEERFVLPPTCVLKPFLERRSWRLPVLSGVVTGPVLRADGSVVCRPGYDPASQLLAVFPEAREWAPADRVGRADAEEAAGELADVLVDFPFVAPCDLAAAVAALLTLLGRHAIQGPAPMFVVRATAAGTGKGLVVDVLCSIATGRRPHRMAQGGNDEEEAKTLLGLGMAGAAVVLIDNIERGLGSPALAAVLTAGTFAARQLGGNSIVTVDFTGTTFLGTGNNVAVRGDLGRRVIPIDMDARVERPEARSGFRYPDILAHVAQHRPRLVRAALTILRGFLTSGERVPLTPFGSFERWSRVVREAVAWVGLGDPAEGRRRIVDESDPEREAAGDLLRVWREYLRDDEVTVAELVRRAKEVADLRVAIAGMVPKGDPDKLDTKKVGYALRKIAGRIIDGRRLERAGRVKRGGTWRVCLNAGADGADQHPSSTGISTDETRSESGLDEEVLMVSMFPTSARARERARTRAPTRARAGTISTISTISTLSPGEHLIDDPEGVDERAAILEHEAGLDREQAERLARGGAA